MPQDFLLKDGDMQIENGDFLIGESSLQHQEHILMANKGEFKEFPEVGVGIVNMLLDENPKEILIHTQRQFEYDGMSVTKLQYTEGKIIVDAEY